MTPAARRGMLIRAQQELIKSSASYDEGCDLLLKVLNDWTEAEVYKKPDFSEENKFTKIYATRDAVIVSLIDGEWVVSIECINMDNIDELKKQAIVLIKSGLLSIGGE